MNAARDRDFFVAADAACFHCGLPLPDERAYAVAIDGVARLMCCAGCAAVAQLISSGGMTDYYRTRSALPDAPAADCAGAELASYDLSELQSRFARRHADGTSEAALTLEGIRCAACAWLNEQQVRRLPGVLEATVNYSTQRMWVRWDQRAVRLSRILAAIAGIGYSARPYDPAKHAAVLSTAHREALKRFALAGLGMMQVMMLAAPAYLSDSGDLSADLSQLLRWASLTITLPVLAYCGNEFFTGAWRAVRHRRIDMDVSIALGLATAFAASVWATWRGRGDVYFDSVTMFLFLLLGVRYLEQRMRFRAGNALAALASVLPSTVQRLARYPASRDAETISTAALCPGDCMLIAPGERVAADGVVLEGRSELDESLLTGESRPIAKRPGERVISGTINTSSPLFVRAEKVGSDTTVAHIAQLMERALAQKPRAALLADRAAACFVAALLAVTAAALAYWWMVAPARAVPIAIALLVITCPCALSLAAPAALTAAAYRLARSGLVPVRAACIERLSEVTDVVFDKTGTLTVGRPALVGVQLLGDRSEAASLAIAAGLEYGSEHPIGRALREIAPHAPPAESVVNQPGAGVQGSIAGVPYRIGSEEFVARLSGPPPLRAETHSQGTVVALGSSEGWIARLRFADALRPEAVAAVRALLGDGRAVHLLSGDGAEATACVADAAGIAERIGDATPATKVEYVRNLQRNGAVVAMIGDGVNDAPSLAAADIAVAMGSGTDIAQSAADLLLLSRNLNALPDALRTARRAKRVMRQNFAWATLYNAIAVPLAAAGYVSPSIAAIGMSVSSLVVLSNALRLAPLDATA